jgi:dTDP-4-dehydrorhamnose reductase
MMHRILVSGANGQLGRELQDVSSLNSPLEFHFFDSTDLDVTNRNQVENVVATVKPAYIVNCAAYTAVDKAENDREKAFAVNAEAVLSLAEVSRSSGAKLIHISTDYVFDGTGTRPYTEDDPVHPLNVYGESKLMGERYAMRNDAVVLRTAWVYSVHGNNFLKTMLRVMNSRPEVRVVNDQFGTPTHAADIAATIIKIINCGKWMSGVFHFTNEGSISWFDFAQEIKRLSGSSCNIVPIPTEEYPTPAKRPAYTILDKTKIQATYGISLVPWQESLQQCMLRLSRMAGQ